MKTRPEILLHPNIPKPMHHVNPRSIMGGQWWDIERRKAYASTGYHCAACGVHKKDAKYHQWLEAHELYKIDYPKGRMIFEEVVPLCHSCHNFIHTGRMQALVDKGEMEEMKMLDILKHGERIIRSSGLKRRSQPTKIAPWGDWRLVFNGEEYPPKFPSYNEWMAHFSPSYMPPEIFDDLLDIGFEQEF